MNFFSSNKEDASTLYDNEYNVVVELDAVPSVILIGKQYQEQVIYENRYYQEETLLQSFKNVDTEIGPEVVHEYKVVNKGPSELSMADLIVSWQNHYEIDNEYLNTVYLIEAPYVEGPLDCEYNSKLINANVSNCKIYMQNVKMSKFSF